MSLDITLLSVLKHRESFNKLYRTVNDRAFDIRTVTVIQDFKKYFEEFKDCATIPVAGDFVTFFTVQHRTLTEEQISVYRQMFRQIDKEPSDEVKSHLTAKLLEANLAVLVADITERWTRGEEVNLGQAVRKYIDDFESDVQRKVKIPFVDIGDNLFKDAVHHTGLSWRMECLNLSMRKLRIGDFGILAARPDAGKTSAIASEITHMAPQIAEYFKDEPNRPILWFNNEGPGERIQERIVQAALGIPASQIVLKQKAGTLWPEYQAAIGGLITRIRVLDIHGYKSWQVEEIIKQTNPALVVYDMIDNIRFDGEIGNGGQRTDQVLEAMYQWGRELAVRYRHIALATSQISADGDGMAYPTLGMLKDSKTGKQGAVDFIITLGKKNEPAYEAMRFIGLTKNKLRLEGRKQSPNAEVAFDATACRFYSLKESAISVDIDDGRGDDDKTVVRPQSKPVRPGQSGSVDGSEGTRGTGGLPETDGAGAGSGVAGEDALGIQT